MLPDVQSVVTMPACQSRPERADVKDENFVPKAACSASIEAELSSTNNISTFPPGPLDVNTSEVALFCF